MPIFWNSGLDPDLVVEPDGLARPGSSAARKNGEVGSCVGTTTLVPPPPPSDPSKQVAIQYYSAPRVLYHAPVGFVLHRTTYSPVLRTYIAARTVAV